MEELIERLVTQKQLVIAEVALWEDGLATYEAARSLELDCGRELDANCRNLQSKLAVVEGQLAAA